MLTGELRSKIDNVWNAFWAGGIANPVEVIEHAGSLLVVPVRVKGDVPWPAV